VPISAAAMPTSFSSNSKAIKDFSAELELGIISVSPG